MAVTEQFEKLCNDSMYQPVVRDESVVSRPVSIHMLCMLPTVSTLSVVCSVFFGKPDSRRRSGRTPADA